jgi:probable F420-dependent oxidoreductase
MKIGFFAVGFGNLARGDLIAEVAVHAERLNFSTIWSSEHVVLFETAKSQYPYSRGEPPPVLPRELPFLNPFLALTYAAAHTKRIRLATGICLAAEYNPLLLAKMVASLDLLSLGRFAMGIGIGWLAEEYQALGIPWERRAERTREYVEVMRTLWRDPVCSHRGEFVNFEGVLSYPKPIQGASLPVLLGGQSEAALKRAAEYGNGWIGINLTPDETARAISRLRELLDANGRSGETFEFLVSPVTTATADDLPRYRDAGIDELYVPSIFGPALTTTEEVKALLEWMARTWVEPASKL